MTPPRTVVRRTYLRALGACHVLAHGSLWLQADALFGDGGLAPVRDFMAAVLSRSSPLAHPTWLWLWPSPGAVHVLCGVGMIAGALLLAGVPIEGPLLLLAWSTMLSLCTVGDPFLGFQWDSLLLEASFVALFVARWRPGAASPPAWAFWLQWWLFFRLMFLAGYVKLASGDPTWRDLSALDVHFWTQPMPNPASRWAHHWPGVLHQLGVVFMFAVELGAPLLIPFGRVARAVAAAAVAVLMVLLAATGNYGFFQVLTVTLCLPLLDDGWLPARWRAPHVAARPWASPWLVPGGLWALLGALWMVGHAGLPRPGQWLLERAYPFRSANPYGLFAVMTTDRVEVVFEGSWDGGMRWQELVLPDKPGPVDRVPRQIAPHMPRVEWQLWFAGLSTCRANPWVNTLMTRLVEGSPAVTGLFEGGPFVNGPPDRVRALAYRYTFTPPGSQAVWERVLLGRYCAQDAVTRLAP